MKEYIQKQVKFKKSGTWEVQDEREFPESSLFIFWVIRQCINSESVYMKKCYLEKKIE